MEPTPSFWAGRRVCVTGGTGFLGGHLVRHLVGLGAEVRVFALPVHADHPSVQEKDVERIEGDVLDIDAVRRAVRGCSVIFHTAGLVATWGPALTRMHSVHVEGTRNVLACASLETRVVHTSSLVAVGASRSGESITEDWSFNLGRLRVAYVQAKHAAEEVALRAAAAGQAVFITNPSYLVGPEDHDRSNMGQLLYRFCKGQLFAASPCGMNVVDVRDAACGHLLTAEHGTPGRRYLLGGEDCSMRRLLRMLAEAAGYRPRWLPRLCRWHLQLIARMEAARGWLTGKEPQLSLEDGRVLSWFWYCNPERARREIGYTSRPLAETLSDTYRWHCLVHGSRLRAVNRWWMRPSAEDRPRAA